MEAEYQKWINNSWGFWMRSYGNVIMLGDWGSILVDMIAHNAITIYIPLKTDDIEPYGCFTRSHPKLRKLMRRQ